MALLAGSLTSELERSLVSDSKAGPDMIEIRPGIAYGSVVGWFNQTAAKIKAIVKVDGEGYKLDKKLLKLK